MVILKFVGTFQFLNDSLSSIASHLNINKLELFSNEDLSFIKRKDIYP